MRAQLRPRGRNKYSKCARASGRREGGRQHRATLRSLGGPWRQMTFQEVLPRGSGPVSSEWGGAAQGEEVPQRKRQGRCPETSTSLPRGGARPGRGRRPGRSLHGESPAQPRAPLEVPKQDDPWSSAFASLVTCRPGPSRTASLGEQELAALFATRCQAQNASGSICGHDCSLNRCGKIACVGAFESQGQCDSHPQAAPSDTGSLGHTKIIIRKWSLC